MCTFRFAYVSVHTARSIPNRSIPTDYAQIEAEIAKGCQLLYLETPTNPTIKIIDIKRLAAAAKKVGALVVVDNTFATPINQNPLQLGADIVLHSASKYLGGHADALGGVICGRLELVKKVYLNYQLKLETKWDL